MMNNAMMIRTTCLTGVFALALLNSPHQAAAQGEISNVGVPRLPERIETQPATPEALARLTYGGSMGMMYMDNIYRSPSNEESDFIAVVAPGIALRTEMDRHEAKARLRVEGGKYMDNGENDYVDVRGDGKGRYQITDVVSLLGDVDIRRDHVAIGAFVDDPDRIADEPTIYFQTAGNVGLEADNGAWYGLVSTGVNYLNYDNADARGGGTVINDDRDRTEWGGRTRLGAYVAPQWLAYAQATLNQRNYRTQIDSTALFGKDSNGYGAGAGLAYGKENDSAYFDANLGYISQDYDNPALRDIDTIGAEALGKWRISDTWSLHASAVRSIEENTLFGASGHIMTRGRVGFEYDFAPQWELEGDVRFTHNDFEFNPANGVRGREDDILDTSMLVEYNIIGDYFAGVEYIYVNRDSTDSSVEYSTNAAIARLSLKY